MEKIKMKRMLFALVALLSFSLSALAAVNLNTATQVELESLKNIGPAKAQAIIDYRKKSGGFKTIEDLNNVPGIGDKTMTNLKNDISVSGVTTIPASASKPAKNMKSAKEMKMDKSAKASATATPMANTSKAK